MKVSKHLLFFVAGAILTALFCYLFGWHKCSPISYLVDVDHNRSEPILHIGQRLEWIAPHGKPFTVVFVDDSGPCKNLRNGSHSEGKFEVARCEVERLPKRATFNYRILPGSDYKMYLDPDHRCPGCTYRDDGSKVGVTEIKTETEDPNVTIVCNAGLSIDPHSVQPYQDGVSFKRGGGGNQNFTFTLAFPSHGEVSCTGDSTDGWYCDFKNVAARAYPLTYTVTATGTGQTKCGSNTAIGTGTALVAAP